MVTSVKIQLHDSKPFYQVQITSDPTFFLEIIADLEEEYNTTITEEDFEHIGLMGAICNIRFAIDFLFNPEKLNVTREQSNHCGSGGLYLPNPSL